MTRCNYQPSCSYPLTATGPSERPQSAPSPGNPSSRAALADRPTLPQANPLLSTWQTRRFFLPTARLRRHSSSAPYNVTPLVHSIPIAPTAVSSN